MKNNIPLELRQLPQWACARADKAPLPGVNYLGRSG